MRETTKLCHIIGIMLCSKVSSPSLSGQESQGQTDGLDNYWTTWIITSAPLRVMRMNEYGNREMVIV